MSRLHAYVIDIVYVEGKNNVVANILSRRPHLCYLVEITADWRELISAKYAKEFSATIIIEASIQDGRYNVINELNIYKERTYLVPNSKL